MISLPASNLIGTLLETILYGAYFVLFTQHMVIMRRKWRSMKSEGKQWAYWYLLGTGVVIFILVTIHVVVDFIRAVRAYTGNMSIPDGPTAYFLHFNTAESRLRTSVYTTLTIVSDAFLVYRCFSVWGGSILISIVPFLLFLADCAVAIWATWSLSQTQDGDLFQVTLVGLRSKYFYVLTLSLNLLCTSLIAFKIWKHQRMMKNPAPYVSTSFHLSRLSTIIVESAAIYSAVLATMIATTIVGSPSMFIFLTLISPVIGLVFSSIIVRVNSFKGIDHQRSIPNDHRVPVSGLAFRIARDPTQHECSDVSLTDMPPKNMHCEDADCDSPPRAMAYVDAGRERNMNIMVQQDVHVTR